MTFDPGAWRVGGSLELRVRAPRSYLFSPGTCRDLKLRAAARIYAKGGSGIDLLATLKIVVPKG